MGARDDGTGAGVADGGAGVTAPARISQADVERATKAVAAAKLERARIVLDLNASRIEIIIGETGPPPKVEEWSDDDV